MPGTMPENVLRVQDDYLRGRAREKGIVTPDDIPVLRDGLSIWQGDITRLSVDAIVNAANSQMLLLPVQPSGNDRRTFSIPSAQALVY